VSMVKIWVGAFWGDVEPVDRVGVVGLLRRQPLMAVGTTVIVVSSLAIAVAAGPFYEFAEKAARQTLDIALYISAVRSS